MARFGLLAALVFAGFGCGGGDPCAGSRCPNDSRPTQTQYQDCVSRHNADRNKKCNAESLNYELCVQSSTVCTSGGTTDGSASLSKANSNCSAAFDAVLCCNAAFFCK